MGIWILCIYGALLLAMGWVEHRRAAVKSQDDAFYVNGRSSGTGAVAVSIVASCVGGSATLGMAGLAWNVGTPAFWWLGSGAIGLGILSLCLARRVRASGARTMPEMLDTFLGRGCRPVASLIIVTAWMAILAAQYSALATIITSMADLSPAVALWCGAGVIVAYSILGGQAAVIRSDVVQYAVLIAGLALALAWMLSANPTALATVHVEAVNSHFTAGRLGYYLAILGGSYVVCPMLFGRLLSAKDAETARRGGLWAVLGLVLTAALIVAVGLACRGLVPEGTAPERVLTTVIEGFPVWLKASVLLALFSAIISSADSCLLTAATVCGNDLLPQGRFSRAALARMATCGLGLGGLLLATSGKGILGLLLMANDIYVCGVVAPVFVGMLFTSKERGSTAQKAGLMIAAMMLGGTLGLLASMTDEPGWSYAGLSTSALLAIVAVFLPVRRSRVHEKLIPNDAEA